MKTLSRECPRLNINEIHLFIKNIYIYSLLLFIREKEKELPLNEAFVREKLNSKTKGKC